VLKVSSTQQNHCSSLLKVTWKGEKLKMFNIVEHASKRTRGTFYLVGSWRVRYTRGLGDCLKWDVEREDYFG
jgi:hypothetical protein